MSILRTLFACFRRPAAAPERYGAEVLFAGWVDLPPKFRERQAGIPAPADAERVPLAEPERRLAPD